LILETGLKHVTLKLSSIFEELTLEVQTDADGEARFSNLAKDEYVASVEGFQLKEIKVR